MAIICSVCRNSESKYKCPKCELRYCSIGCYKTHKLSHVDENLKEQPVAEKQVLTDRPGTKQRVAKPDFTNFENDPEFKRLIGRYPTLKLQLQAVYAMTLEPGPEDARSWNRPPLSHRGQSWRARGPMRGRPMRGRGGRGGPFGGFNTAHRWFDAEEHERQHGPWTKEKGDKEALRIIRKARLGYDEDENRVDGMREFIELCKMRFGNGQQRLPDQSDIRQE